MATQLQLRRGTNAQVTAFTGAEGEVSVNTTNDSLHIHDGSTAGGFELARADLNNVSDTDLNAALTGNTVSALTITTLTLGSTAITATGTEINLLDGVTATTAELNILDGVTATATEINLLDGVTATTAELNYVDGVTSAIQTQLDAKAPIANPTFTGSFTSPGIDDNADAIAITIDSSENVGIGTSSPQSSINYKTLSIYGSTGGGGQIALGQGSTTHSFLYSSDSAPFVFYNQIGTSEAMRINSVSQVGIGVTPFSAGGNGSNLMIGDPASDTGAGLTIGATTTGDIQFGDATTGTGRYAGLLRYSHTDDAMAFWTGSSERLRVTSGGSVGIGTSSPASLVTGGSSPVLTIGGTDSGLVTGEKAGSLSFITSDSSYTNTYSDGITGEIASVAESATGAAYGLAFYTGTISGSDRGERLRINNSGAVLIGTSTATPASTTGVAISGSSGYVYATRDGNASGLFNRLTSDGDIAQFRKDGTTVGSISTTNGDLTIYSSASGHGGIRFAFSGVLPVDNTGALSDATEDIGQTDQRWKDLYLSNQIIGGFGAQTTTGTTDWNHSTNARSGMGTTLLLGTATNGPGPSSYFHAVSFEYNSKNGSGNMTQLAIGYNVNRIFMRYRYQDSWSSWTEI